jgi:ubiquinone/menaquinone biosynthesis C-methylase UbiE
MQTTAKARLVYLFVHWQLSGPKKKPSMEYNYDMSTKLRMIGDVFSIPYLLNLAIDDEYVKKYYWINKIPYSIFHTLGNAVHMGISRDGLYKEDDLYEQARFVEGYIESQTASGVLELGGGRGINSIYLAKKLPNVSFTSLDFSHAQTSVAKKLGTGLRNFKAVVGSYQDLSSFGPNTFSVVFAVETICHSLAKSKTLSEAAKVLSPGGVLIVFDGYRGDWRNLSPEEKTAVILVEKGMAVAEFAEYEAFCRSAELEGFRTLHQENLSPFVVPTMQRFESLAGKFFRRPGKARILSKILPSAFVFNAVSGFLMPSLMEAGATEYWVSVFQK